LRWVQWAEVPYRSSYRSSGVALRVAAETAAVVRAAKATPPPAVGGGGGAPWAWRPYDVTNSLGRFSLLTFSLYTLFSFCFSLSLRLSVFFKEREREEAHASFGRVETRLNHSRWSCEWGGRCDLVWWGTREAVLRSCMQVCTVLPAIMCIIDSTERELILILGGLKFLIYH